jgi:hypothetical protein
VTLRIVHTASVLLALLVTSGGITPAPALAQTPYSATGTIFYQIFPAVGAGIGTHGVCTGTGAAPISLSAGNVSSMVVTWYDQFGLIETEQAQGRLTVGSTTRYFTWSRTVTALTMTLTTNPSCSGSDAGSGSGSWTPTGLTGPMTAAFSVSGAITA